MATQVSGLISPRSGNFIAEAKYIAYDDLGTTVAEAIAAAAKSGSSDENIDSSKVIYKTTINGTETSTPLNLVLSELSTDAIDEAVTEALNYANSALTASNNVTAAQSDITTKINTIDSKIDTTSIKIDALNATANKLATIFNADAQFLIMSESLYNNLTEISDSTIYFCYAD